jgi:hypothetical protein
MKKPWKPSTTTVLRWSFGAFAATVAAAAGAFVSLPASAQVAAPSQHATASTTNYLFSGLTDQADATFNQLLGINSHNVISGYFGSGQPGHPNKGYLLDPPYGQANYVNENFPGSAQTQVVGLNNLGDTAGFWANAAGANNGFVEWNGAFETLNDPSLPHMKGAVDQLLGVNDHGVAVGFYNDAKGHPHAYEVNQATRVYTAIKISGAVDSTATGINNNGDIVGFATDSAGNTFSWLLKGGHVSTLQFPGGNTTEAFGVNDHDEIVGTYLDASNVQHGFTLKDPLGTVSHWQKVDDPNGVGDTFVNGINDAGDLVGFYCPSSTNCDGFLAMVNKVALQLQAMPTGTVSLGTNGSGDLTAAVNAYGLTPGSPHAVRLLGSNGATLATFSTLKANGVGQGDATLDSSYTGSIPSGSSLAVYNGPQATKDKPGGQIIADTASLDSGIPTSPLPLTAQEITTRGKSYGTPAGAASVAYSPTAQSLTVTVTASGVTPGNHAAHIHLGSCQSQGAVQYMLMDFTANTAGQISNETRTVTGVTSGIPATGWYLNLHQGTSANILKNGAPTIWFRPLLCANI